MSNDLHKNVSYQVEGEMHYGLSQRKPNQRQGAMAETDVEDGALLLEKPHCLESSNLLESSAGRSRTKRVRMQGPTLETQDDIDELTDEIKLLRRRLKKAEEKKAEAEAKAAAARAGRISSGEAYDKAKQKLEELAPKLGEAQKSIEEFETQWKETVDGLELAMEEFSRLESSL